MKKITVGEKELTFVFDTAAWVDVEATFGSIDRMYKRFDDDIMPITAGLHLAAITATSGSCDRDKKQSIPFEWLVKHATPEMTREIIAEARAAVIRGMATTEDLFDDGPVDAGLEEEEAKKIRADA